MATIKDVARMAGVSISTVSKYMNGGTVRQENIAPIREAIAALDYRVNPFARGLKAQRNRSVGILLPDLTTPFFGAIIGAMDKTFREYGYHSIISCYDADHGLERDNLRFLLTNGIDGLIYIPEDLTAEEYKEITSNGSIPVVQVDRVISGVKSDTVLVDNAQAAYKAVMSLAQKGHRRIALITGSKAVLTAKERQVGYLNALTDSGIHYDDDLFISGLNNFATGYHGCEALLQLPTWPTAVFTTNYNITLGFITAARERGIRIPEQIDVFGFDCVDICTMLNPPIPVIRQPEQEIGRTAAMYLIERMQGCTDEPRTTRLECNAVVKESV
jgi:LacI family transcriptional regulator